MIYRFTEVLNDLVNYFLLGDILLLEDWKQANHLSDDLAMEFTHKRKRRQDICRRNRNPNDRY